MLSIDTNGDPLTRSAAFNGPCSETWKCAGCLEINHLFDADCFEARASVTTSPT
jgi:hypothetical protein